jgi:hypothetical protein
MLQNKDKNIKDASLQSLSDTAVLFSRTEKVTTALYMVTDCMSDTEPIRHRLRQLSVSLVSLVRSIVLKNQFETHFITTEITHTVEEILSFLTMSANLGFISIMNYEILYKEFNKVNNVCRLYQHNGVLVSPQDVFGQNKRATNFVLDPEFFADKNLLQNTENQGSVIRDTNRHSNGHEQGTKNSNQSFAKNNTKESLSDKSKPAHIDERNQRILDFVKSKGQFISVTDISNHITDCSEKTIQRSLIQLVETGVLKRVGEKRWARYGIV